MAAALLPPGPGISHSLKCSAIRRQTVQGNQCSLIGDCLWGTRTHPSASPATWICSFPCHLLRSLPGDRLSPAWSLQALAPLWNLKSPYECVKTPFNVKGGEISVFFEVGGFLRCVYPVHSLTGERPDSQTLSLHVGTDESRVAERERHAGWFSVLTCMTWSSHLTS